MIQQRAVVIGGGPAGLTAAYELATRTSIEPTVLEQDAIVGGISRTINYRGNRIDIGGHRFFSKSDRVMKWWLDMLPVQAMSPDEAARALGGPASDYSNNITAGVESDQADDVMLVRARKSRIYYTRRFFDYPISLSTNTVRNLGLLRTTRIGLSYLKSRIAPVRHERSLEDFLVNRFGRELYETFFASYTEKVWGVPCHQISAEWGAQRIKGLSVSKAIASAVKKLFRKSGGINQKSDETSLIEQFLYPKFGPGQMWETCARKVREHGGSVHLGNRVCRILVDGTRITGVIVRDEQSGGEKTIVGDHFFSTMPIQTLVRALDAEVPPSIRAISEGLVYRDFVTVGLLLSEMTIRVDRQPAMKYPSDNWIYIQEPDVRVGRLQIFNNWSPSMVADRDKVWVGLEYFCNENDDLWVLPPEEMARFAIRELVRIGMIEESRVLDWTVIQVPKAYPAYFGTYDRFDTLRSWLDRFENLFLLGRNGMHRYNNQDHSMLTAMVAVDNLLAGRPDKSNIWEVNTEQDYHEELQDNTDRRRS